MNTICAWCGRPITFPEGSPEQPTGDGSLHRRSTEGSGYDEPFGATDDSRTGASDPSSSAPESPRGGIATADSHGICAHCVADMGIFPIENLATYERSRFDELPFGIIEVDRDGRVLTYNRWEEELAGRSRDRTLGRLFFSEVAPCTGVAEFEGRFREMVARNEAAQEELDFVFRFPGAERLVNIRLIWAPRWERGFILVRTSK